jgi:hypothetical protein
MNLKNVGLSVLLACTAFAHCEAQAAKPEESQQAILRPIRQLVTAFNDLDPHLPEGIFSPQVSVIDEFPPFYWNGASGADDWWKTLNEMLRNSQITGDHLTIGDPIHRPSIVNHRAYLTLPLTIDYVLKGEKLQETGHWTFVLEQAKDGRWLILSHAYDVVRE